MLDTNQKSSIILHIDMNSYFASVEQQANPFLRGKALGVCAYLSPNGVIIASSVEAKAKGIKTGCKVRDAKLIDPDIVLVENEPAKYRSTTDKIFNILKDYSDRIEPYSIDEAFIDLNGWAKSFKSAKDIAQEIQVRIKLEVGEWLNCSIGISWTRWLAKFAGDIAKKKSVLVIDSFDKLNRVLKTCELQDAWGINKRTEIRLNALGIYDLVDLKNFDSLKIKKLLGWCGYYLWANVNGLEITKVSDGEKSPKSIGHSYCIPKKTRDKNYLGTVFYKLCERTGRRLRKKGLEAESIHITLAYTREGGIHRSITLKEKLYTTEEIYYQVEKFLKALKILMPIRMVAVSVSSLSPVVNQMTFFKDRTLEKNLSLSLDQINDKFGEFTVMRGKMFGTDDIAKDRIGFRKLGLEE